MGAGRQLAGDGVQLAEQDAMFLLVVQQPRVADLFQELLFLGKMKPGVVGRRCDGLADDGVVTPAEQAASSSLKIRISCLWSSSMVLTPTEYSSDQTTGSKVIRPSSLPVVGVPAVRSPAREILARCSTRTRSSFEHIAPGRVIQRREIRAADGGRRTFGPERSSSHRTQSVHQLPSCRAAVASHRPAVPGGGRLSLIQWLPLPFDGGLIIPAMWPLAASTKRTLPPVSWLIRQAERQGTIWSFSAPTA